MRDLKTIRFVMGHYPQLQGLRIVPLGVTFLGSAIWRAGHGLGWVATAGSGARWFWVSVALAVAGSFLIQRWYHRRFGAVRVPMRGSGALFLVMSAGCFLTLLALQTHFEWPVSVPLVFAAFVFGIMGLGDRPRRRHYLWIGVGCLSFAALHPLGVPPTVLGPAFDVLIGASLIAAGIGDHRILRQACAPASEAYVCPV